MNMNWDNHDEFDDHDPFEPIVEIESIGSPSNSEDGTDTASEGISEGIHRPIPIPLENQMDTIGNGSNIFSVEDVDDYSGRRGVGINPNGSWRPSTSLDDENSVKTIDSYETDLDYIEDYGEDWPCDHRIIFGQSNENTGTGEPRDTTRVQDQVQNLEPQLTEGIPDLSPVIGEEEVNKEEEEAVAQPPPQQQPPQQKLVEEQLVDGALKRAHPDDDDGDDDKSAISSPKKQKRMDKKDEDKNDAGSSKI